MYTGTAHLRARWPVRLVGPCIPVKFISKNPYAGAPRSIGRNKHATIYLHAIRPPRRTDLVDQGKGLGLGVDSLAQDIGDQKWLWNKGLSFYMTTINLIQNSGRTSYPALCRSDAGSWTESGITHLRAERLGAHEPGGALQAQISSRQGCRLEKHRQPKVCSRTVSLRFFEPTA